MSRNKRLRYGEHVNRNFGIKSFYPKIGGHVFTPNLGRRTWELEASKIVSSRNRLHKNRYQLVQMWYWDRLSSDDVSR